MERRYGNDPRCAAARRSCNRRVLEGVNAARDQDKIVPPDDGTADVPMSIWRNLYVPIHLFLAEWWRVPVMRRMQSRSLVVVHPV